MKPDGVKWKCDKAEYLKKCRNYKSNKAEIKYSRNDMVNFANWYAQKQYEEQGNVGNAMLFIHIWEQQICS